MPDFELPEGVSTLHGATAPDIERTVGTDKAQAALMISQSPNRLLTKANGCVSTTAKALSGPMT
jgi:hypothetical protein